jgi:flagellar basal body-associated protein FliL
MPDSQWLNHHAKRKNYLWLIVLGAAACIAAGIFIKNNSEIFYAPHAREKVQAPSVPPKVVVAPVSAAPVKLPEAVAESPEAGNQQAKAGSTVPRPQETKEPPAQGKDGDGEVTLNNITCRMVDKTRPSILLSLSLVFPKNQELQREILMKRDDLKIMVQKTLASKSFADMIKDSLRKDIKAALNPLLERGAVTDVEFKEFRIDKVE